jgi:pimeloyl-ACP methyl ester carboxylesterase
VTHTRDDVTFPSGDGRCGAWLYRPEGTGRPPVVVMAHGFGATRQLRLDAYARRFAGAGYAVVVFDYRHFGDSSGEPRELLSIPRQHEDWRSALTYARSLAWADARVVVWGSSLGGGHVLHTAANDPDLAAVIAQVPHVSGPVATRRMGTVHATSLGLAGLRDQVGGLLGRPPYYRPSIGDPGSPAVMVVPDAMDLLARLADGNLDAALVRTNRVAARVLLQMPRYSPGRNAHRISAPTLVQAGQRDELTPPPASRKVARRIPDAEFKLYPCGHFDPYLEPYFPGVVSDQLAFLAAHVPIRRADGDAP